MIEAIICLYCAMACFCAHRIFRVSNGELEAKHGTAMALTAIIIVSFAWPLILIRRIWN